MSISQHHREAEELAQKGHLDDEIRKFLNNVSVEPYQIEMIIQDLEEKYPGRSRKRPFDYGEIILYIGSGVSLIVGAWIVVAGSGYLFFVPVGLGGFLTLMGIAKLFQKRQ